MDKYSEKLNNISEGIDGLTDIAFVGHDGIIICQKANTDMELLCANYSDVIVKIKKVNQALKESIFTFDDMIVLIKDFNDGFICMKLAPTGNLGRARISISKLGGDFCV